MSAEGVLKAVYTISDDLYALIVSILEDDSISSNTKVGRNTLADSDLLHALTVAQSASDDVVIQALFNNYVVYLEWDRPPRYKKAPPISALKDWAAKNGIPTDANTLYAISYAIWRDGHKGRPIFATMDKEIDKLFTDDWADRLQVAILDNMDLIFND